jgi:hypothetical protein
LIVPAAAKAYGFTPEDLLVCRQQLMLFVNQYDQVPYKASGRLQGHRDQGM